MSWKTWCEEFMPITAEKAAKENWTKALEHSIKKWSGLTSKRLGRHNLKLGEWHEIVSSTRNAVVAQLGTANCALCQKTVERDDYIRCNKCLIQIATGANCIEAFDRALSSQNPKPMLDLLRSLRPAAKKLDRENKAQVLGDKK